jgi:hypothetical protein
MTASAREGAVLLCLLLGGCATAVGSQPIMTSSGARGFAIRCNSVGAIGNALVSWGDCYRQAGEICGTRGYTVLQRSDEAGYTASVGQYGGAAASARGRSMTIQCGGDGVARQ